MTNLWNITNVQFEEHMHIKLQYLYTELKRRVTFRYFQHVNYCRELTYNYITDINFYYIST